MILVVFAVIVIGIFKMLYDALKLISKKLGYSKESSLGAKIYDSSKMDMSSSPDKSPKKRVFKISPVPFDNSSVADFDLSDSVSEPKMK